MNIAQWNQLTERVRSFSRESLIKNALYIFGANIFPSLIGFVYWWAASHLYSADQIGEAAAIISTVTLVSWIAGLGTNYGIIRFLSASEAPNRLLNSVFSLNILSAILMGAIYLVGVRFWTPALGILNQSLIAIALFFIFNLVSTLGTVVRDTFIAYRKSQFAFQNTLITNMVRLVTIGVAVWLGSLGLVLSTALGLTVSLFVSWYFALPKASEGYRFRLEINKGDIGQIIPFSIGNSFVSLISQLNQTILPIIILQAAGAKVSGCAYIVMMVGLSLISPGQALANSAFAETSHLAEKASYFLAKAAKLGLAVTLPLALVVGIAAPFFLGFFGQEYSSAGTTLLRIMAVAAPFLVLINIYFTYLRFHKRIRLLVVLTGLIMIISLLSTLAIVHIAPVESGGFGLLIGNGVGLIIVTVISRKQARRILKTEPRITHDPI